MKYGARNQLNGTVTEIKRGSVMAQVNLDITTKATISSVVTLDTLEDLDIKDGDKLKILVKAVNVVLVKE